jgi:hypothetical protein
MQMKFEASNIMMMVLYHTNQHFGARIASMQCVVIQCVVSYRSCSTNGKARHHCKVQQCCITCLD